MARPINRMSRTEAALHLAKIRAKNQPKQPTLGRARTEGRPRTDPWTRLIDEKYAVRNEEGCSVDGGNVHVLDIPAYLIRHNEALKMLEHGLKWKLVRDHYIPVSKRMAAYFTRNLNHWEVDKTPEARAIGKAKLLRDAVNMIVFTRVAPQQKRKGKRSGQDDDNNGASLKYVRDTLCAWLVDGPLFDPSVIGEYDDDFYHPENNPNGKWYGIYRQEDYWSRIYEPDEQTPDGKVARRKKLSGVTEVGVGRFGLQIELHQDPKKLAIIERLEAEARERREAAAKSVNRIVLR
jgi:hypothetical protein